jgi:polyhydroxyalkanoate synthase
MKRYLAGRPGEMLNVAYVSLMPFRLMQQKYVSLVDILKDPRQVENFLRMEKWIFDSPDQAGEAFRQFMRDFYQGNKLINGGLRLGKHEVDLRNITMPVLNIFAEQDHLVPPDASRALQGVVGTKDYTQIAFKGGHIGIYVSGRAQREVPPAIHDVCTGPENPSGAMRAEGIAHLLQARPERQEVVARADRDLKMRHLLFDAALL